MTRKSRKILVESFPTRGKFLGRRTGDIRDRAADELRRDLRLMVGRGEHHHAAERLAMGQRAFFSIEVV